MRHFIYSGFILLLTTQVYGETYSWVDDSGTYNYTEDYAKVPKKYQKKVKRREDIPQDVQPQKVSPDPGGKPPQVIKTDERSTAVPAGEAEMYGGKSRDAWRKEMEVLEAELGRIEQHMEQLRKQMNEPAVISKGQFDLLKKDYNDSRSDYAQKYKSYNELIERIRKAGIIVEIKK